MNTSLFNYSASKSGPSRKLSIENEFFFTLMKLRLDTLQQDLVIRFDISTGNVSQIFITWIKLLSHEVGVLIIWPSCQQITKTLPECFQKLHTKCCPIIDCAEIFTETPRSLEAHILWSDYKHHTNIKILVCITLSGAVLWALKAQGTSDVHIVCTSGFLKIIESYDQIIADRGFKINTDLAMS